VPFTLFYAGKYRTEDKNTANTQNTTHKCKQRKTQQKQNYPGLVAFYGSQPRTEVGSFYNTLNLTQGRQPQASVVFSL